MSSILNLYVLGSRQKQQQLYLGSHCQPAINNNKKTINNIEWEQRGVTMTTMETHCTGIFVIAVIVAKSNVVWMGLQKDDRRFKPIPLVSVTPHWLSCWAPYRRHHTLWKPAFAKFLVTTNQPQSFNKIKQPRKTLVKPRRKKNRSKWFKLVSPVVCRIKYLSTYFSLSIHKVTWCWWCWTQFHC